MQVPHMLQSEVLINNQCSRVFQNFQKLIEFISEYNFFGVWRLYLPP